jgi:hypothetical protein
LNEIGASPTSKVNAHTSAGRRKRWWWRRRRRLNVNGVVVLNELHA